MQTNFAKLYDLFNDPVFYEQWFALLTPYLTDRKSILDLGCGSGTLLALLQKAGHDVSGVDTSSDMLSLAREKLGLQAKLYENDMVRFFTGEEKYDIIVSTCDSLNYLSNIVDVEQVFKQVYAMLKPGGFFFFDIHSDYMFLQRFTDWTFGSADQNVSLIWNIVVKDEHIYEHELTFFSANEQGLYERYDSLQVEYFYPEKKLLALLQQQQFLQCKQTSDFSEMYAAEGTRTFFSAQKSAS